MSEGVDLYGLYNKVTDWNKVKESGIDFAWVKLSDGETNRDDYGYVSAGNAHGLVMGGYHYAQPGNAISQANRLIDRCELYGATQLAPALDIETPFVPGQDAINFSIRFLNQLIARGHTPCIYANNSMLAGILPAVRKAVPTVKVWAARYGGTVTVPHDVHQYTSTGRVNGISGDVDRNRGDIIRNTLRWPQKPIQPVDNEDGDDMILPAGDNIIRQVPVDGKEMLFIAVSDQAIIHDVACITDNREDGQPGYVGMDPIREINPHEPGPIHINPGCRVAALRYSCPSPMTVWVQ
jgi:GH25 family lysozyme M1 (1,4-beta-N-acetylmuramidase)